MSLRPECLLSYQGGLKQLDWIEICEHTPVPILDCVRPARRKRGHARPDGSLPDRRLSRD